MPRNLTICTPPTRLRASTRIDGTRSPRPGVGLKVCRNVRRLTARAATPPAFLALALTITNPQASGAVQALRTHVLPNGLDVVVLENHTVPLATAVVAVRAGAFTQREGEQGLAHLFEHVLFRAYGDPGDFGREVGRLNGTYNGATQVEVVTYYLMFPSKKTKDAIRLLARLFSRARFSEEVIRSERPIVLDELARVEADPEQAFRRRMTAQLWGDDWYRRDVIGDSTALGSVTSGYVEETFQRLYVPSNAALIVTGDVDFDEVVETAAKHFDDWESGPSPYSGGMPADPLPPLSGLRAVVMPGLVPDVTIRVALRGPGLLEDSSAAYAGDLFATLLNQSESSIQAALVGKGLFQSLSFQFDAAAWASPMVVRGVTTEDQAEEALRMLVAALDQIGYFMDVTPEQLAMTSKKRHVAGVVAAEQTATFAPLIARRWAGSGLGVANAYSGGLSEVTAADLTRFAESYVMGAPKVIGVLGPAHTIERLLASFQR